MGQGGHNKQEGDTQSRPSFVFPGHGRANPSNLRVAGEYMYQDANAGVVITSV